MNSLSLIIIYIIIRIITYYILFSSSASSTDSTHFTLSAAMNDNPLASKLLFICAFIVYICFLYHSFSKSPFIFWFGICVSLIQLSLAFVPLSLSTEKPHKILAVVAFILQLIFSIMLITQQSSRVITIIMIILLIIFAFLLGFFGMQSSALSQTKNNETFALITSISELLFNLTTYCILLLIS